MPKQFKIIKIGFTRYNKGWF